MPLTEADADAAEEVAEMGGDCAPEAGGAGAAAVVLDPLATGEPAESELPGAGAEAGTGVAEPLVWLDELAPVGPGPVTVGAGAGGDVPVEGALPAGGALGGLMRGAEVASDPAGPDVTVWVTVVECGAGNDAGATGVTGALAMMGAGAGAMFCTTGAAASARASRCAGPSPRPGAPAAAPIEYALVMTGSRGPRTANRVARVPAAPVAPAAEAAEPRLARSARAAARGAFGMTSRGNRATDTRSEGKGRPSAPGVRAAAMPAPKQAV